MKRKQYLFTEERKWEYGTIIVEDGICVIENEEGDMLLAESLPNAPVYIQLNGVWEKAGISSSFAVIRDGRRIPLSGGESIRYEKSIKRPLMALLDSLDDETFLAFLQHLRVFGLSVFDCVFSYNKGLFSGGSPEEEEGVSFYHFSNDEAQCALQHHYSRGSSSNDRFEWTASDGKRSIMYSAVQRDGTE
ncbi:DUF2777 domain-containing protein [Bacillus atrophaeus]|uniref:DUF2777 domain-containing protein n=1 Tax=Bacillus atrophaeus TaxID=1452 RepID=UPI000B456B74|nr:DUF2777 domain-containing protein [Bacillus atrophaeus]ARW06147.1 uncharacterized protein S101359_01139 [Bacillus atrophaeus]MCY8823567.1 DUF2777 domain-containing protein [Bacillus atrophaeus]MCY8841339.1 DUF2777 domain-containing protein [Bacillus atrophaeus]MCY8911852.1 DUF2777 domain-containing protein [Bacillus atrophaeus]MCY8916654.1 DUF2777 domain-containing protein [Bacillus atrophaeus]